MNHKFRRASLACVFFMATQIFATSSAVADVIDLICNSRNYWIDTDKSTVTMELPQGGGGVEYGVSPVEISATAFSWVWAPQSTKFSISRVTGVMTMTLLGPGRFLGPDPVCAKGSTPLPATKF